MAESSSARQAGASKIQNDTGATNGDQSMSDAMVQAGASVIEEWAGVLDPSSLAQKVYIAMRREALRDRPSSLESRASSLTRNTPISRACRQLRNVQAASRARRRTGKTQAASSRLTALPPSRPAL